MNIGKTLFLAMLFLSAFAGIGVLHIAQITGLINVQVSITPQDWVEKQPTYKK